MNFTDGGGLILRSLRLCHTMMEWRFLSDHKTYHCLERVVKCPFQPYGCGDVRIKAKNLSNHLETKELRHISMKCNYLEKESRAQKTKSDNLSQKVATLEEILEEMKLQLRNLRRERDNERSA